MAALRPVRMSRSVVIDIMSIIGGLATAQDQWAVACREPGTRPPRSGQGPGWRLCAWRSASRAGDRQRVDRLAGPAAPDR